MTTVFLFDKYNYMSKKKLLKVELTKEFKSKDKVIYTNYGRFKKSKVGKVTLLIDGKKVKANYA